MITLGLGMVEGPRFGLLSVLLVCAALLQPKPLIAEQVPVRHMEGLAHGFLALRNLQGKLLANGELTQVAKGDRVTSHVIFRFNDGSIYEDTAVFSQRGSFRLLNDHVVQKGPSFKQSKETWLDASTGQVKVRYTDDGKEKTINERLDLPPDVGNGLLMTLVKHIQPSTPQTKVSWVATTPKPRLVNLVIVPQGEAPLSHGTIKHKANYYVVKVEIGGVAGLLARLVGKQPPDTHVWVLAGHAPAFVKLEGQLDDGGPIWRIELATPAKFP
jgi:hypothetical protein